MPQDLAINLTEVVPAALLGCRIEMRFLGSRYAIVRRLLFRRGPSEVVVLITTGVSFSRYQLD